VDDFLGRGWRYPPAIDPAGGVALSRDADKIRQSINIILSTAKGERVMRPDFGCDIHSFVFASMNA
jgi:phage baseplate assembly protein W